MKNRDLFSSILEVRASKIKSPKISKDHSTVTFQGRKIKDKKEYLRERRGQMHLLTDPFTLKITMLIHWSR